MGNSEDAGCFFGALLWLGTIGIFIGSGFLAWNWIEPDNFGESIIFLIIWSILGAVGRFLVVAVVGAISGMK
jgi:hypothetical protein